MDGLGRRHLCATSIGLTCIDFVRKIVFRGMFLIRWKEEERKQLTYEKLQAGYVFYAGEDLPLFFSDGSPVYHGVFILYSHFSAVSSECAFWK